MSIGFDLGLDEEVATETNTDQKIAPFWKVLLWNDDYHSYEFVIKMVMKIFRKTDEEAFVVAFTVDQTGSAVVATCNKERAELYLQQVASMHEGKLGPLNCSMEPDE
jgi:ATP-dependent Clp protease adaptor protein ClpS